MRSSLRKQSGFTIVEVIIVTLIISVLASIAINSVREYSRRAKMSEVVLASSTCKTIFSESFPVLDVAPEPGEWGCERSAGNSTYAGAVQTSAEGVIRIKIRNLDSGVNDQYVYLAPARNDGVTPMTTASDLGNGVRAWICGSDFLLVRKSLPANCRTDTLSFSYQDFGP